MMSSENIPPPSQPPDHNPSTASRKPSAAQKTTQEPPQPHPLKCPRCDSSNTKFCYYNNYSLTQPRHFCKTCRRYWTKGGALRNVPIGGGCRKTKKLKPPSSLSPSPSYPTTTTPSSEFRFLAPPPAAAMEFQLGGLSLPRLHPATAGVYTHFIASSGTHHHQPPAGVGPTTGGCLSLDLLGLANYPPIPNSGNSSSINSSLTLAGGGGGGAGGDHTLTISSIESLSTINQEMHWKLQQQRLALIYGPSSIIEQDDNNNNNNNQQENNLGGGGGGGGGEINLFKNLETRKKLNGVGGPTPTPTPTQAPTEWLFDQIQVNSSSGNYGVTDDTNNNNTSVVGVNTCTTTSCNNNSNSYEDFNGVWTTELHHHHHHQFNGLQ